MTAKALEWRYFVSRTNDGDVLEIVRRSFDGVTYGPFVQALTPGSEWVDRPQILHAFQDPGWYVPVSEAEARSAAAETGGAIPADEPTDEEKHAAMVAALRQGPERADRARHLASVAAHVAAARRREEVSSAGRSPGSLTPAPITTAPYPGFLSAERAIDSIARSIRIRAAELAECTASAGGRNPWRTTCSSIQARTS